MIYCLFRRTASDIHLLEVQKGSDAICANFFEALQIFWFCTYCFVQLCIVFDIMHIFAIFIGKFWIFWHVLVHILCKLFKLKTASVQFVKHLQICYRYAHTDVSGLVDQLVAQSHSKKTVMNCNFLVMFKRNCGA